MEQQFQACALIEHVFNAGHCLNSETMYEMFGAWHEMFGAWHHVKIEATYEMSF
jgi:hypothetical protein